MKLFLGYIEISIRLLFILFELFFFAPISLVVNISTFTIYTNNNIEVWVFSGFV